MTEFAVMPEGTKILPGDRVTVVITVPDAGVLRVEARDGDIRVIERLVPEVVLPTVPGYYESAKFPLGSDGSAYAYRLSVGGQWYCASGKVTEERMREVMPLARLVPEAAPAKLADRIDPDQLGGRMDYIASLDLPTYQEDGAAPIAAIDNGELDK